MNNEYRNKVIQGNNLEVLKQIPDNTFDSVVTDPPYGISFMGKKWDYDVPSVETWKEVLRVLKPGGHMLVACGTKTQHRMAINIEDAGFEIRDIVAWVYGSGFPKSMDISKALDKHLGAEREVVGKAKGVGNNNTYSMKNGRGGVDELKSEYDLTKPSTEQAKQWQGWGTALKPAMELWTLARKPLIGTVAENVLKHGVGGLNIDESRIEGEPIQVNVSFKKEIQSEGWGTKRANTELQNQGRFPANFIHDGSDEVVSLFPYSKAGKYKGEGTKSGGIWSKSTGQPAGREYGDSGSASRFFYVAKASKKERNYGLSFMERKNTHPTVKPINLMRYLVNLVNPKGGIVLDLFAGSGSTLIGAKMGSHDYFGIECEEEYVNIIKHRLKAWNPED